MTYLKRNRFRDKTSFFTENKNFFLILIGILGLVGQFYKLWAELETNSAFLLIVQMFTIVFGVLYLYFLGKEDTVERARDEFKEYIENKRNLELLIGNIFYHQIENNIPFFNIKDYKAILKKWHENNDEKNKLKYLFIRKQNVQSFIDDIGLEDFGYLLLTKGENAGLMEEKNKDEFQITL